MDLTTRLRKTIATNLFLALVILGPFALVFALRTPSVHLFL